jgi:hypothetical protein
MLDSGYHGWCEIQIMLAILVFTKVLFANFITGHFRVLLEVVKVVEIEVVIFVRVE